MKFNFVLLDYIVGVLFGLGLSITILGEGSRRTVWQLYIIGAIAAIEIFLK